MIMIAALIIGALIGWRRAKAMGGNGKDIAQYAAVHGLIFLLVGVIVTVLLARSL